MKSLTHGSSQTNIGIQKEEKIQSFKVSIILIEKPDKLCNESNRQTLFVNIDVKVLKLKLAILCSVASVISNPLWPHGP